MSKILNKKLSKNLKENGYIFVPIDKINKIFITKVRTIIHEYLSKNKISLLKLDESKFSKHIFEFQLNCFRAFEESSR